MDKIVKLKSEDDFTKNKLFVIVNLLIDKINELTEKIESFEDFDSRITEIESIAEDLELQNKSDSDSFWKD